MTRHTVVALLLLLGCGCISTNHAVRSGGDEAVVTFNNGASYRVELLAVTPDDLYFLRGQHVWRSPLADLSRVRVGGYSLRTAKCIALGCSGAVDAAMCVAFVGYYTTYWPVALLPVALVTVGAITSLGSEPRVGFRTPLTDSARARLALYCRYPRGLTDGQWQEFMSYYRQHEFLGPGQTVE